MPIDLTGITNENEFYTHHYLSAILENDLKDVFNTWKQKEEDEGIKPPYSELRGIAKEFFIFISKFSGERNPESKLKLQREFTEKLFTILGYSFSLQIKELDDNEAIPILAEVKRSSGAPELWIIETYDDTGENISPLDLSLSKYQNAIGGDTEFTFSGENLEEIITRQVFGQQEPPRWVLLINHSQLVLIDRSKWNQKSLLMFDLIEIFGRKETTTLQATAALLHRESICPSDGLCLLDTFDENSHKHAFAVSEDLKYALRRSIELLGNEAVYYMREILKEKVYDRDLDEQLTRECLRYMYRLLFLFYIEARPELGYAPMKADAYRKGYSLETLRDLEMAKLTTEESRNGIFICESLNMLFHLIYNGFSYTGHQQHHVFAITALKSHLFDPERTPILNRIKFRNSILQQIIQFMSLSSTRNRRERRGRISYAQLGINQLGAVYEALLSYKGFFAETDLYEVKKAGEQWDELQTAYFVKEEDLSKYTEDERVYNEDGTFKKYPKGTFIYRLAGRDREKSASYYTPEVLTKCLVKYALKELLKDKTADDILKLKVCEPAMGSAAFLNEAINQLAEAYLQLKQKEINQTIPHDRYEYEKQKVKMYLADNNVFGVDLNPVAVELAEVSLWLNTIHEGGFVPWFGMQLVCGNSLIGARRQVFASSLLCIDNRTDPLWLDKAPERVVPGEKRPDHSVYHFLLPDKGMADYKDRVIRQMVESEIQTINAWRRDFTRPFSASEIKQLEELSNVIDRLWEAHIKQQRDIRSRTTDPLHIFGQPEPDKKQSHTEIRWKERVLNQEMLSKKVRASSHYRRLKLAMDYWCAIWFWPIEKAGLLPSRQEFLLDLSLILEGNVYETSLPGYRQLPLFPDTRPKLLTLKFTDMFGIVDVDKLCNEVERLALVKKLADKYHFLHWELEFADIFDFHGGFDLVLGNPPWIKVEWKESSVLGDYEPIFVLRRYSASHLNSIRKETIKFYSMKEPYFSTYEKAEGTQNYLNAYQNYPLLKGIQTNLYKCFLPQSWMIGKNSGIAGFLHPEGVYDDPNGGILRNAIYTKLVAHFQFQNELNLFADVDHHNKFSINIFNNKSIKTIAFLNISNLFMPKTIDACYNASKTNLAGGIKTETGDWNLEGHKDRIININEKQLLLFAKLFDDNNTNHLCARLPSIHMQQILNVLARFANHPKKLCDIKKNYLATGMWHETNAQTDGTIRRETCFPNSLNQWILSGPHFYVGTPFYKTPRKISIHNSNYDPIDLIELPEYYLPRTNYVPACILSEFKKRTQNVPWNSHVPVTSFYRLVVRRRLSSFTERTLIAAIMPKCVTHIQGCFSIIINNYDVLVALAGAYQSIVFDFYIKSTGKTDFWDDLARHLPILDKNKELVRLRTLMLNCLTDYYAELWEECWDENLLSDSWTKHDSRLTNSQYTNLGPIWKREYSLRADYTRRQALIEIDVLVSMALGLTLDELKTIYRIQFPVLNQNEQDTWYDQKGRIVFTCSKGLPGVGFSRPEWNEIRDMKSGTVERKIIDDTLPGGPRERTIVYEAPFDRCDREKDYEIAWAEFERRFKEKETSQ